MSKIFNAILLPLSYFSTGLSLLEHSLQTFCITLMDNKSQFGMPVGCMLRIKILPGIYICSLSLYFIYLTLRMCKKIVLEDFFVH